MLQGRVMEILPSDYDAERAPENVYEIKGLRFDPSNTSNFDMLEAMRLVIGEDIPRNMTRMDASFDSNGFFHQTPRPLESTGGMDFEKAEKEFFMMILARYGRGLTDMVDREAIYGYFDNLKSPHLGKQQGFCSSRIEIGGQRGDDELNSLTNTYMGILLSKDPEKRRRFFSEALEQVYTTQELVANGEFAATDDGLITSDHINLFGKILHKARGDLAGMIDNDDPTRLAFGVFTIGFLNTLGVGGPKFREYLADADHETMDHWRSDIGMIHRGAGMAARIMVDHGIGHEQPYPGNLRYIRPGKTQRAIMICDWHDAHDLLDMTYPQAVGYIGMSVRTLALNGLKSENHPFLSNIGPAAVEEVLMGFFQPTGMAERGLVHEIVGQTRITDKRSILANMAEACPERNIDPSTAKTGLRSLIEVGFFASEQKPVTEVEYPIFDLIKRIYPHDKHTALKERFGV